MTLLAKPAVQVLPHRETMLLLDQLTEYHGGYARCTAVIAPDNPFLDNRGRLEAVALVEMLAQGAAALRGFEAIIREQPPRVGYLVGVKHLEIAGQPRVGDSLTLQVQETFSMEQVSILDSRALIGDKCLASGALKVWEDPGRRPPACDAASLRQPRGSVTADLGPSSTVSASPIHRAVLASLLQIGPVERGTQAAAEFRFDESFLGFHGHFPGDPILPGIVMLKMALVMCERVLDEPVDLVRIDKAKFSGQALPMQLIRTEARLTSGDGYWLARVTLVRGEDGLADFRLRVMAGTASRSEDLGPEPKQA